MVSDRVSRLLAHLENRLDPAAILTGDAVGAAYTGDATSQKGCLPQAVLRPRNTHDVSTILSIANQLRQPLVVQGGRTGLSGAARPQTEEIALSTERMTSIDPVDRIGATIIASAGAPLETVQVAALDAGLMFGVDIGARGSSTIGGNIATNAGGIRVLRYGMYRAQVIGLEAVLSDGTVLSSLKGLPKDNSGYDLGQLFIGTEGTLGVITRACLKLHPKPRLEANAFLALPSLAAAQTLFLQLRSDLAGLLSAFEIIFPAVYEGVTGLCGQHPPVPAGAGMYALVEIQGQDESRDRERFETALMQACNEGLANDVVMSSASRDFKALWAIRDGISEFIFSLDSLTGFDIGVPLAGMQSFLDAASDAIAMIDPDAEFYIFGHLGDGNLHYIVKTANPDAVADVTFAEVARAGGTISAEHGIGLDKVKWLNRVRSDAEIAAMRRLKAAFDPNSILNPGRIFDVRSPLAHAGRI